MNTHSKVPIGNKNNNLLTLLHFAYRNLVYHDRINNIPSAISLEVG